MKMNTLVYNIIEYYKIKKWFYSIHQDLLHSLNSPQNHPIPPSDLPPAESHSKDDEQSANAHPLPNYLTSENSNNSGQRTSSAAANEFVNLYGNMQESFDDEQQKVTPGKNKMAYF